jgi:hypothetical protein
VIVLAAVPATFFAAWALGAPSFGWRHITHLKAAIAVAGALLLAWDWSLHRAGRAQAFARTRDGLLLALALLAGLSWWNLGLFHRGHYVHEWDTYHYYMGAKYFPELGYLRLYHCTVVADAQEGHLDATGTRTTRDLENNRVVSAEALAADAERCTRHFAPARWAEFKRDLAWFRAFIGPRRWPEAQRDHGFNATPVWLMLGHLLASTGPVSSSQMLALTAIDAGLLLAMWAAAWWGFGWRATGVAVLYWGTNYPAFWGWTGGGYLRQDWLFLCVLGLALLRRGFPGSAGAALAAAGLLRVFPWAIVGGLALGMCWQIWERRSLSSLAPYRRFAVGFALAVVALVPAASATNGGWGVWPAFVANSAKHASTPAVNNVGLPSLISYDHDRRVGRLAAHGLEDDAFRIWRENRARVFSERRPLFLVAVAVLIAVLAFAVRRQPDWIAAILGVSLMPLVADLACYYYALFLVFGFLALDHRGVGVALVALAAATWFVSFEWSSETRFAAISAAVLGFVIAVNACMWRLRQPASPPPPDRAPTP